jgi:hypothetical protein
MKSVSQVFRWRGTVKSSPSDDEELLLAYKINAESAGATTSR